MCVGVCVRAVGSFLEIFGYDRCRGWLRLTYAQRADGVVSRGSNSSSFDTYAGGGRVMYFFSFSLPGYLVEPKGLCLPYTGAGCGGDGGGAGRTTVDEQGCV